MYDAIIVLGSTATGKTKVSIDLAKLLKTEIINADSMYIYKELNIGTAKPTLDEMSGIKHHIIDVAEPNDSFNVVDYRKHAEPVLNYFKDMNLIPIVVGGTGFYIESLVSNYTYGEATYSPELRSSLQQELENKGKEYLYNKLKSINPTLAEKLHVNDTFRVIRALEISINNKNEKCTHLNNTEPLIKNPLYIGLTMDREILYDRINKRVDLMVENGLVEEVSGLYYNGYNPIDHQSMKGIGYKEIVEYLEKKCTLDEALGKIKQHTRNYAKRQITWFKRNKDIHWFNPLNDEDVVQKIVELFNKKTTK